VNAIRKCNQVRQIVNRQGLEIEMLNLGGGFPIEHSGSVPSISEIGRIINKILDQEFPYKPEISIEPGRGLVGEAGTMVSRVIAKANRNGDNWLYLDVGVFNGLMESMGGIKYNMLTDKDSPMFKWTVAGPSCDGMDCVADNVNLPELATGDRVYIWPAGAYTTAYASQFNGISIPKTYFV
jgi:ornithine decarboxylase